MNRTALLECIRTFRKQVMNELDRFEDALTSIEPEQPEKISPHSCPEPEVWMTAKEVCKLLKIGQTTFYDYIRDGLLPPGFEVGPRSKRWRMSDIQTWRSEKNAMPVPSKIERRVRKSRVQRIEAFYHA